MYVCSLKFILKGRFSKSVTKLYHSTKQYNVPFVIIPVYKLKILCGISLHRFGSKSSSWQYLKGTLFAREWSQMAHFHSTPAPPGDITELPFPPYRNKSPYLPLFSSSVPSSLVFFIFFCRSLASLASSIAFRFSFMFSRFVL